MKEIERRRVREALESMAVADLQSKWHAEGALESISSGQDGYRVLQRDLQAYLWYRLPRHEVLGPEHWRPIAAALGTVFARLGLDRLARVCRSTTTEEIFTAWRRSARTAVRKAQRAEQASGVEPPDLPDFSWGDLMGPHEASGQTRASIVLEEAIDDGALDPGARGWQRTQRDLLEHVLAEPHPEVDGSWREVIEAERLDDWVRGTSAEAPRAALLRPLAPLLRAGVAPPADVATGLAPLRYLLERAAEGLRLTGTHRLHPDVVIAMAERFDWWAPGTRRQEEDMPPVLRARLLLEDLGAVVRRKEQLLLTPRGRQLVADPEALWRATAARLAAGSDFDAVCRQLALAALARDDGAAGGLPRSILALTVREALVDEGWHQRGSGEPITDAQVRRPLTILLATLRELGLAEETGPWEERRHALTDIGRPTALEALRAAATGPRADPR